MALLNALGAAAGGGAGDADMGDLLSAAGPSSSSTRLPAASGAGAGPSSSRAVQAEIRKAENESSESEKSKRKKEDEERLAQIYESLSFDGLWDKLSESLSRMEDDSSAAMILLPLIEVSTASVSTNGSDSITHSRPAMLAEPHGRLKTRRDTRSGQQCPRRRSSRRPFLLRQPLSTRLSLTPRRRRSSSSSSINSPHRP